MLDDGEKWAFQIARERSVFFGSSRAGGQPEHWVMIQWRLLFACPMRLPNTAEISGYCKGFGAAFASWQRLVWLQSVICLPFYA